jgi:hypothetical protein
MGQLVMECVVQALCDVKVTGSKPAGTKNSIMLRVSVARAGQVRSLGDFDDLDAPESQFLSHKLVPHLMDKQTNKQKK